MLSASVCHALSARDLPANNCVTTKKVPTFPESTDNSQPDIVEEVMTQQCPTIEL